VEGYRSFGLALFSLAEEEGMGDEILRDCEIARGALSENGEYLRLLDTPALPKEERLAMIDSAFGTLNRHLVSLIKILAEGGRAHLLMKILEEYARLYNEARGIIKVSAISARPLSEEQIQAIEKKISAMTGKRAVVDATVDQGLLGGVKLRYLDKQIDGSVKGRLEVLSDMLSAAKV
jgi:F-type H+-transporting ATPase subunit delta